MSTENESTKFPINRWGAPVGDGFIYLHDYDFDFDNYFDRHAAGELSEEEKGDFAARVYGMFCRDFFKSGGNPAVVQPWVAVKSRLVINTLDEQFWFFLLPFLECSDRGEMI